MKRTLAVISVVCAVAAHGANLYNSSLGSFALENADNCEWNISIGAASMMGATNTSKSVFLGNRAGQSASSVSNCVGIGWGALRNKTGTERATDINGQFTADKTAGTVGIYSDPSSPPVASYSNGVWRMSGDLLIEGRVSVSNRVFSGSGLPTGYDFYVDAQYGDDENDGLSVLSPKQTLDAALNLVVNDTSTVCVRAGRYAYPEYFKKGLNYGPGVNATYTAHKVTLVGVDGAENTVIANDGDDPAWVSGYPNEMMTLQGLTFTGFNGAPSGYWGLVCPFTFVRFVDCIFRDTTTSLHRYKWSEAIFNQCVFENCKMRDCHFTAPKNNQGWGYENGYYYTIVFFWSLLYNCDIRYSSARVSDENWECSAVVGTELIDTYLQVDTSRVQPRRTYNGQLVGFSDGCIHNSTVLIGNISGNGTYYTRYYDSIFGYGGSGKMDGEFTDCYTNSVPGVSDILGDDKKPLAQSIRSNPSLAFYGWGEESAIASKNGIVSFVSKAITDSIPAQASEETATALRSASARLLSSAEQTLPTETFGTASAGIEDAQLIFVDDTNKGEDD